MVDREVSKRWLHLAAEGCLDLAHHLIADRGWRTFTEDLDDLEHFAAAISGA